MRITVTISDELAAQAQARGLTPESYVEKLIAEQTVALHTQAAPRKRLADLEKFFEEMAAHSDKIPLLPGEAFTRESLYADHD
jgi:hypothetical protein